MTSNSSDPTSEHYYEGCTSATCNEHTFCKSDKGMNWGSAFTWCLSNGRKQAKFSVMCPGIQTSENSAVGACPNLTGIGQSSYVWTPIRDSYGYGINIDISSGKVRIDYPSRSDRYAFCE